MTWFKKFIAASLVTCLGMMVVLTALAFAAEEKPKPQTLLINCNIFDGVSDKLATNRRVLVEGNLIKEIGDKDLKAAGHATVIDCGGRTLMPGLIDGHSHLGAQSGSLVAMEAAPWDLIASNTVVAAKDWLMDGFTTVRDMGGLSGKGVKKVIDRGDLPGPRIYPSGAIISQTSGHGDLKLLTMRNPQMYGGLMESNLERLGISRTADGRDAVLTAVRRQLQMGASQIKIMAGGGVASESDPWHSTGYTLDEMKAAVEAAADYGTYVAAHVNQPYSMKRCLEAGIISIEHGFVMTKETIQMIVERGAFLSTQMTGTSPELAEYPSLTAENLRKLAIASYEMKDFIDLVKKHQPKQTFNIDAVLTTRAQATQQRAHEIYLFGKAFGNFAMLRAATSTAGELLAMSGKLSPYPKGKLGLIEKGAYADILLVDGNPLENLSVIGAKELWYQAPPRDGVETINLIMKDGKVYKNTLK
jgi:imidazolonepropionase-like amidohydrolase